MSSNFTLKTANVKQAEILPADGEEVLGETSVRLRSVRSVQSGSLANIHPSRPGNFEKIAVDQILQALAPTCDPSVLSRLKREGVVNACDLACLDKEDLKGLGFSMLECSRILRWVSGQLTLQKTEPQQVQLENPLHLPPKDSTPSKWQFLMGVVADQASPGSPKVALRRQSSPFEGSTLDQEDQIQTRLDEAEKQADFWCELISSAPRVSNMKTGTSGAVADLGNVRENFLEMLFDLTEEHVREVYNGIDRDADGRISAAELKRGLERYNLPELSETALARVLDVVAASKSRFLQLPEFEAVLSRLKLAQILQGSSLDPSAVLGRGPDGASRRLAVLDFSCQGANKLMEVSDTKLREFFFGHRQRPKAENVRLVRWVHLDSSQEIDLTLLLALTVKYSLHPLSVEDVIEQCPTKIDSNGRNYFVAIEHLCLTGQADGSEPVRVRGRHVAMFCAGPPTLDTIITISQPDRSFKEEWPGSVSFIDEMEPGDAWVDGLRDRLQAPLSRLRERLADFLMYQIIDLCTDEITKVTRAYTKRLMRLEMDLHAHGAALPSEWAAEVSLARLQLAFLSRRVRGLQRVVRHVMADPELAAGSLGYYQDVTDHLNEAFEDAGQLGERCSALADNYEHTLERGQERVQQITAERLNKTLFVLTVFTTVFAPLQFFAGVYGMNFVRPDGSPNIPELRWENAYQIFWTVVAVYMVLCLLFTVWLFRRLQRTDRRAKGLCMAPMSLCSADVKSAPSFSEPIVQTRAPYKKQAKCCACTIL